MKINGKFKKVDVRVSNKTNSCGAGKKDYPSEAVTVVRRDFILLELDGGQPRHFLGHFADGKSLKVELLHKERDLLLRPENRVKYYTLTPYIMRSD